MLLFVFQASPYNKDREIASVIKQAAWNIYKEIIKQAVQNSVIRTSMINYYGYGIEGKNNKSNSLEWTRVVLRISHYARPLPGVPRVGLVNADPALGLGGVETDPKEHFLAFIEENYFQFWFILS